MKRAQRLALTLFPVVILLGWNLSLKQRLTTGKTVTLAVQGVDPRDLLSGHYLTYRVQWGPEGTCHSREKSEPFCYCLKPGKDGVYVASKVVPLCTDRIRECETMVRGTCEYSMFTANIERYYFPEDYAQELARVPPDAHIEVQLDADGNGLVSAMTVGPDKMPLLDWAKAQKKGP